MQDSFSDIFVIGQWRNHCAWPAYAEHYPCELRAAQKHNPLSKRLSNMYLDEIVAAQQRGEGTGLPSICSAHPAVLQQALRTLSHPLIEATCNQVNQFGGYTGMTPADF